jgi:hypothetical protein
MKLNYDPIIRRIPVDFTEEPECLLFTNGKGELMPRWVKKWEVEGNSGSIWVVSVSDQNEWGCSCPVWKFRRQTCHHILDIKTRLHWNDDDPGMLIQLKVQLIDRYLKQGKTQEWIEKNLMKGGIQT